MTDYIVKCSDVSWQRHSVAVNLGSLTASRTCVWRPPYNVEIKRVAVLVTNAVSSNASNYHHLELVHADDDSVIAYIYTEDDALAAEEPNEMTVVSTTSTAALTEALVLKLSTTGSPTALSGFALVIDYEPAGG